MLITKPQSVLAHFFFFKKCCYYHSAQKYPKMNRGSWPKYWFLVSECPGFEGGSSEMNFSSRARKPPNSLKSRLKLACHLYWGSSKNRQHNLQCPGSINAYMVRDAIWKGNTLNHMCSYIINAHHTCYSVLQQMMWGNTGSRICNNLSVPFPSSMCFLEESIS